MKTLLPASILALISGLSFANTPVSTTASSNAASATPATVTTSNKTASAPSAAATAPTKTPSTTTPAAKPTITKDQQTVQTLLGLKNYTGAYAQLETMAKNGDAEAYFHLASMTEKGIGTKKDEAKAIELYKSSSRLRFAPAQHALGMIYGKGLNGAKQNLRLAKQYFDLASAKGLEQAQLDYGIILLQQEDVTQQKEGLTILAPYIAQGNLEARYTKALYDIAFGVKEKNEERVKSALTDMKALAEGGYAPALIDMGKMLMLGQFFPQNLTEAKKIFTKLNEAKVPQAGPLLQQVNQMLANPPKKK